MDDEVDGIFRLFNSDRVEPTNIGNPIEFTIHELSEVVIEETGSSSALRSLPLPGDDPKVRQLDITVARDVPGLGAEDPTPRGPPEDDPLLLGAGGTGWSHGEDPVFPLLCSG